jgi:thiol-disulfide isomerase/thioredoxin
MKSVRFANLEGGDTSFLSKITNRLNIASWSTLIIILVVILFIVLSIFYYYKFIAPKLSNTTYTSNNEYTAKTNSSSQAELILFYVDWCPHCKSAMPDWEEIKEEYSTKTVNGYKVIFTEVNCTNESPEIEKLMNKFKIEGYPTIKLLKDGQVIDFDAKPTKSTLDQFLNTVL